MTVAIGWMVVVLAVALMARSAVLAVVSPQATLKRVTKVEQALAGLPMPEVFLGRIDALEKKLQEAASPTKVVSTVNAHSLDLLEMKQVIADLRRDVAKMRTGDSLRMTATGG